MEPQSEKSVQIKNPERILRIFRKICQGNLAIFLRPKERQSILVRARVAGLEWLADDDRVRVVGPVLTDFSEAGHSQLLDSKQVIGEFVMMNSRILFHAKILRTKRSHVLLAFPDHLDNVERRQNNRVNTSKDCMAYVSVDTSQGRGIMPTFSHFRDLTNFAPVFDLSQGGVCFYTYLPLAPSFFKAGAEFDAKIALPMESQARVKLVLRWIKKIRAPLRPDDSKEVLTYRYGCAFVDPPESLKQMISKLMHVLVSKDAL